MVQVREIDGSVDARQGELLFRLVAEVPAGCVPAPAEGGQLVVGHSETGHHHTVAEAIGVVHHRGSDPLVSYLEVGAGIEADLVHRRPWHTHDTFRFLGGTVGRVWEVRRAREMTPEGWAPVVD